MATREKSKVQGEGDYDAARRYRKRTDDFVDSGKVEPAARNAAPHSDKEAKDMSAAEKIGLSHSKGDDSGNGMKKKVPRK